MKQYLYTFAAMTFLDGLWAAYVRATATELTLLAMGIAAGIILTTGYVTKAYIKDSKQLIPAALGAAAGTWIGIKLI